MIDCPLPLDGHDRVLLGHGSGGRLTSELIDRIFHPAFENDAVEDQAVVNAASRIAFTTDSFVVRPLFFPGGDIGKLAVHGTINDLAVGGARPRFLSAAFILEEGLPLADLARIAGSMRDACREAGVRIVTGDTKVVDRGKGDGVFITTSGIGFVPEGRALSIRSAREGDRILVSGPIGDHGIAILSVREGLAFETELASDTASLADLTEAMLESVPSIRCMRDLTRGGLAGAICDLAKASSIGARVEERAIPIRREVRAACDMLGLDPLHVACEGRLMAVVPREDADRLLACMRAHPKGRDASIIGEATARDALLISSVGSERRILPLWGEQLPRIC